MTNTELKVCTCKNPNGFRFIEYKGDHQLWLHIACNGIVKYPLQLREVTWRNLK